MKEIKLTKKELTLIQKFIQSNKIKTIEAEWDGMGGFEYSYNPDLLDEELLEDFNELMESVISKMEIDWDVTFEVITLTNNTIEFIYQETKNLSFYDDLDIKDFPFVNDKLIKHILDLKKLDITTVETNLSISQSGKLNSNEFNLELCDFIIFGENDKEIKLKDKTTKSIISENMHNFIIEKYTHEEENSKYNLTCEDQQLYEFNIVLEKKKLILK